MKTLMMISALIGALGAAAARADEAKTLGGCELTDKGGYFVKADATCEFGFADDGQEDRDLVDADHDASTPATRVGS